jgi:RimJ/RimL family protein N-acetyltransferase
VPSVVSVMRLRPVELDDLDLYYRVRCDPAMMAEVGGPLPRAGLEEAFRREVGHMRADRWWVLTILAGESGPAAGTVSLWPRPDAGHSEMGWMVLTGFQGRGLGTAAAAEVLERAGRDGRWGTVHATPSLTNGPSNAICRALGFTLAGEVDIDYAGRTLRCNDWQIAPSGPHPSSR